MLNMGVGWEFKLFRIDKVIKMKMMNKICGKIVEWMINKGYVGEEEVYDSGRGLDVEWKEYELLRRLNFDSDYGEEMGLEGLLVDLDSSFEMMEDFVDKYVGEKFEEWCGCVGDKEFEDGEVSIVISELCNVGVRVVNWRNFLDECGVGEMKNKSGMSVGSKGGFE